MISYRKMTKPEFEEIKDAVRAVSKGYVFAYNGGRIRISPSKRLEYTITMGDAITIFGVLKEHGAFTSQIERELNTMLAVGAEVVSGQMFSLVFHLA